MRALGNSLSNVGKICVICQNMRNLYSQTDYHHNNGLMQGFIHF